jgi:hypothetical protein
MRLSPLSSLAERIDRRVGWYRLPVYPGIATLIGLRERLR